MARVIREFESHRLRQTFFCPADTFANPSAVVRALSTRQMLRLQLVALGVAACLASADSAAQTTKTTPSDGVASAEVEAEAFTVLVTRQPVPVLRAPGAVEVVDAQRLRAATAGIDVGELLSRVPGLHVQNRHNYAQDTQVSSRGFGARASFGIRGIKIFVDDIPVTIPDGQAQGALIPLAAVTSLEVLRGPWAVAYGNAAGGVISASTRSIREDSHRSEIGMQFGPDGVAVTDLLLANAAGAAVAATSPTGIAAFQQFRSRGFRAHSQTERGQWYARVDVPVAARSNLMLSVNVVDQPRAQDPLGLTLAEFSRDRTQAGANAELFNTRKSVQHQQFGSVLSTPFGGVDSKLILYAGQRRVEQFLAIPVAAQLAPSSAGGVVALDRDFGGVGVRAAGQVGEANWSLGADVDIARDVRRGFENFLRQGVAPNSASLGQKGLLRRDEVNLQRATDFFGQFSFPLSAQWSTFVGARSSLLVLETDDRYRTQGNGDDSGQRRFSAVSTSLGLVRGFDFGTSSASVYASLARGFETPTAAEVAYRADQSSGLNLDLRASRNGQQELGVRWQSRTLRVAAAAFETGTTDEIVQATSVAGRSSFQNAAQTLRRGVEVSAMWRPNSDIEASLAATVISASVAQDYLAGITGSQRSVRKGSQLAAVPRQFGLAEVSWRRNAPGWSAAVSLQGRSKMAADDANGAFAAGYANVGGWINYQQQLSMVNQAVRMNAFVRVDNALDQRYIGSVIVNEANLRYFEPAPGRRLMVGVRATMAF
jgi:iron complex outermembrane recepter protein